MRGGRQTRGSGRRWLLLAPVLMIALVAGCATGSSRGITGTTGAASGASGGPSWINVVQGSPTPSVPSTRGRPAPSPSATDGYLPLPSAAPATTAPQPRCTDANWHAGQINGLTAVPGPGTATVSWRDSGAANVLGYRVWATSQHLLNGRQRDPGATTVKSTGVCAQLSATLVGLYRATPYTVTIEVIFTHQNTDSPRITTVARSTVVTTT